MVAHDGEHGTVEAREQLDDAGQGLGAVGDVVAGEEDDVGVARVDLGHGAADAHRGGGLAHVDVRQVRDAQAVMLAVDAGHVQHVLRQREVVPPAQPGLGPQRIRTWRSQLVALHEAPRRGEGHGGGGLEGITAAGESQGHAVPSVGERQRSVKDSAVNGRGGPGEAARPLASHCQRAEGRSPKRGPNIPRTEQPPLLGGPACGRPGVDWLGEGERQVGG